MITWKVIEGATYRMETSTDLESWDPLDDVMHKATSTEWIMAVTAPEGLRSQFFRILRTDLDPHDESPFGSGNTGGGPGAIHQQVQEAGALQEDPSARHAIGFIGCIGFEDNGQGKPRTTSYG